MSSEEVISDKKLNLSTLSERQAVLFLKHQQSNHNIINNNLTEKQINSPKEKEKQNILLDYHQYYEYKKTESLSKIPKDIQQNRQLLYKQSLKEYIPIKKNIYIDRKKYTFTDDDALPCTCFPRKFTQTEAKEILNSNYKDKTEEELFGCGYKCINRIISCECIESLCKCGISCRNRKFQNQEYADVYPIKTENRGWGLCAGTLLPKGTFVIQYIGEVYSLDSEYGMKKLEEYKNNTCTYLMSLSKNEVIDPTNKGNMARFINHSCEPNCETQKWNVLGEVCVGIFTLRDIQPDEELTFDYGFNIMKTIFQRCLCGSVLCRGYLGIAIDKDKKKNGNYIICGLCKQHCKPKDSIVLCDQCKKVFHKNCTLKKGKYENENNFSYKCSHCIKKDSLQKNNIFSKEKKIYEDSSTFDEYYEVNDNELRKIKKNLSNLINCGARLFWDYQQEIAILGTNDKLEIKISGTSNQIENTINLIKKIKETKSDDEKNNSIIQIKIFIPKIFLRKIIGHQSRNLNMYKSNYNVDITYDNNLITDEIFPIQESTPIQISGKENNVKAVENKIKSLLYDLKVLSIYLMPIDYQIIRNHICNLKTNIDPADVRLRKRESKNERDLKHPFYYISNNNREIVIIGNQNDINKAQKIIKDYIEVQKELKSNFSLSFLFPIYFRKHLINFANINHDLIFNEKKLIFDIIEPEFLRRHLSVYIEGKWKEIIEIKNLLWKSVNEINDNNNNNNNNNNVVSGIYRKHDINEFEQYAFNQEHKLISKSIKNYIIEQNPQIKNWDYISNDIESLFDENNNNNNNVNNNKKTLLENFTLTCDKETKINYLLNLQPGSYKKIFNMKQNELLGNLYDSINEIYESYKESKNVDSNNNDNNVNNEKEEKSNFNNNNFISSNSFNNYNFNTKTFVSKYEEKKVNLNNNNNNNDENNMNNNNLYSSNILNKNSIFNNNNDINNNNNMNNNNNFISHLNSTLNSKPSTSNSSVIKNFSDDLIKNQNVSYNFSDIKQMNINININHNKSIPTLSSSFYGKLDNNNNNNNIEKDKKDYNKNYKDFKDYLRHKRFRELSHSNDDDKYSNKSKNSISSYDKNYHHYHYNNDIKYYDNNYDYDKYYNNNNNNYKYNDFKRDSSLIYEKKRKYYDYDNYHYNNISNFNYNNNNNNNNFDNHNNKYNYNYHSRSRSRSYSKSYSHSYYSRSCSSYKKEYDKHRNYNINNNYNESKYYDYNNDYDSFKRSNNILNKNNYYNKSKYYYYNNNLDNNYYERKKKNYYYDNSGGDFIYKKYPLNNINSNVSHSNSRTNSRKKRRRSEVKIYGRSSSKNNNNNSYNFKKDEIDKIKNNK